MFFEFDLGFKNPTLRFYFLTNSFTFLLFFFLWQELYRILFSKSCQNNIWMNQGNFPLFSEFLEDSDYTIQKSWKKGSDYKIRSRVFSSNQMAHGKWRG